MRKVKTIVTEEIYEAAELADLYTKIGQKGSNMKLVKIESFIDAWERPAARVVYELETTVEGNIITDISGKAKELDRAIKVKQLAKLQAELAK